MVQIVDDPRNAEGQYAHQYENLARKVADLLPTGNGFSRRFGCVEGQLTVPGKASPCSRFNVVDRFTGAYSGTFSQLNKALSRAKLTSRVKVHKADYLDWLWEEFSDTYVGPMSSELLPEIDSYELSMFVSECYRVVTPGGLAVHSFLSAIARNRRQKLMIVADSNPRWTKTPPKEWFSPRPDQVMSALKQAEFRNIRVKRFKNNLIIRARAAQHLLESWDVRVRSGRSTRTRLVREGLEIPDWMIISGRKA